MTDGVSLGQIQFLSQERRVEAIQVGDSQSQQTAELGYWEGSVSARQQGTSNRSSSVQRSTLAESEISAFFSVGGNEGSGGTATTRILTTIRLADPTLVSFSCDYVNFVSLFTTEFSFSLVGNGYNYSFTGDPNAENQSFSQNNVLLGAGDYTLELRVFTQSFNNIRGNFELTAATVPAPGAAGFAIAGAAALAGRRRREVVAGVK